MTIQFFGHPFSSYCWKVLIALHENATAFDWRPLGPDQPGNNAEFARLWPLGKFPLIVDGDAVVGESSAIIEYLHAFHPGPAKLIPDDPRQAVQARMLDRVFDNFVINAMNVSVANKLRPEGQADAYGVAQSREALHAAYRWLEIALPAGDWAIGAPFTIADCAAAPSLFYADWVEQIPEALTRLRAYRARLLARPSVARVVDAARPYRPYFPLGAPDRD
ncbi:glutathione S-transferase family protein [Sphingomonas sp. 28-63-12]|uniref:glutathione S-transferase family protein n=1 Tax=Sphingomonas sp. 28-63-12 TaxID=1970434 RepID=UPI000BDA1F5A|nr:MAG: glutathione S-transferase [Sphingomonas sp. 28-63-12]